jgi:hypothetical protein
MLLMFGLSAGLPIYIHKFETIYFQLEMKSLPVLTDITLVAGPYLWVGIAAAALEGVRRIRRRDQIQCLSWCLTSLLICLGLILIMAFGLYLPIIQIGPSLSNK